jgi:hypothetical protein
VVSKHDRHSAAILLQIIYRNIVSLKNIDHRFGHIREQIAGRTAGKVSNLTFAIRLEFPIQLLPFGPRLTNFLRKYRKLSFGIDPCGL